MSRLVAILLVVLLLAGGIVVLLHGSPDASVDQGLSSAEEAPLEAPGADEVADGLATAEGSASEDGVVAREASVGRGRRASVALSGRVVDEGAKPVAGASVEVYCQPMDGSQTTPSSARSDPEGVFRLAIPANRSGQVRVSEARWALREGDAPFSGSSSDIDVGDLVVQPAAAIAGQVRDARQQPVAGAEVTASAQARPMWRRPVKTDAKGRFEIEGLVHGPQQLFVRADGLLSAQATIQVDKGQRKEGVVIVIEDGLAVFGLVVDDRGQPVADAAIISQSTSNKPQPRWANARVTSDAQGRFRCPMLAGGTGSLEVTKPGHVPVQRGQVAPGAQLRFELVRFGSVRGRLVDESGAAIAGSRVSVGRGKPGALRPSQPRAESSADGSFELKDVKPGVVHLMAEGAHQAVEHLDVTVRAGEATEPVELRAKRGGALLVQVLDPDGAGVAGASVELTAGDGRRDAPSFPADVHFEPDASFQIEGLPPAFEEMVRQRRIVCQAKTDEKGVARLGVAPGRYDLTASHEDFITPAPLAAVVPATGVCEVTVGLRLGGFALVQTFDAAGKPLGRQSLRLTASGGKAQRRTTTDASGKVRLGPLEPGTWHAMLQASGQRPDPMWRMQGYVVESGGRPLETSKVTFRVEPGLETSVRLSPPALATVAGCLRSPLRPLAGATLRWSRRMLASGGGEQWRQTDSTRTSRDGTFRLTGVEPGSYRVQIDLPGSLRRTEAVEVPGPGEHRRDLLVDGKDLVVTVLTDDGNEPVAAAQVLVRGASREASAQGTTDKAGQAHFTLLPEVELVISVQHERHMRAQARVAAAAHEQEVRVSLAASLELVEVKSANGSKLERWFYRFRRLGGSGWQDRWGRRGEVLRELEPGAVEVQARRVEDAAAGEVAWGPAVRVELRAGEKAAVQLSTGR